MPRAVESTAVGDNTTFMRVAAGLGQTPVSIYAVPSDSTYSTS
jgi:hypothetical protein